MDPHALAASIADRERLAEEIAFNKSTVCAGCHVHHA